MIPKEEYNEFLYKYTNSKTKDLKKWMKEIEGLFGSKLGSSEWKVGSKVYRLSDYWSLQYNIMEEILIERGEL